MKILTIDLYNLDRARKNNIDRLVPIESNKHDRSNRSSSSTNAIDLSFRDNKTIDRAYQFDRSK
jgi:hypothetical protein